MVLPLLQFFTEEATLILGEGSYAEVFRTAVCALNWHRANKGFDVLISVSATGCSALPDKMSA